MKTHSISALSLLFLVGGCGLEVGNPKKPGGAPEEEVLLLSVRDSEIVAAQVDEAMSSVTGEESRGANLSEIELPSLSLWGGRAAPLPLLAPQRDCEPLEEGKVLASYSDSRSYQGEMRRRGRTVRVERTDAVALRHTWSTPDGDITCSEFKQPLIPWLSVQSLRLETRFSRRKVRKVDLPTDFAARMAQGKSDLREGQRIIELRRLSSEGGERVFEKTISFQVEHKLTLNTNREHSISSAMRTRDEAPLVVRIEMAEGVVTHRVLQSGAQVATQDDGSRVEMSFHDLVFPSSGRCVPESGTVQGSFFDAGTETPRESFALTFQAGVGSIRYGSSGETDEFLDDCL